jgi:hypothetical protein
LAPVYLLLPLLPIVAVIAMVHRYANRLST